MSLHTFLSIRELIIIFLFKILVRWDILTEKIRKLQGIVHEIAKAGESIIDDEGNRWEKCIFTIELTNFSKRTPNEVLPNHIKGKKINLVRFCCFDWHYKLGVKKTLDTAETEAVLSNKPSKTVYW